MGYATPIERGLLGYAATDDLLHIHTTEYSTTSGNYVLKRNMYYIQNITPLSQLRITAEFKVTGGWGQFKIMTESGNVIWEPTFNDLVYTEQSVDTYMTDVLKGEKIGVYLQAQIPFTAYFKNLSVKGVQTPLYTA